MMKNLTAETDVVNTNDRNILEFRAARSALQTSDTTVLNLYQHLRSSVDQSRFDLSQLDRDLFVEEQTIMNFNTSVQLSNSQAPNWMNEALTQFFKGNISGFKQNWIGTPRSLRGAFLMACSKASGPADANFEIDRIRMEFPGDAAVLAALNRFWKNRPGQATEEMALAIEKLEEEKWTFSETAWIFYGTLDRFLGSLDQDQQKQIFGLLEKPLASRPYDIKRRNLSLKLSEYLDDSSKERGLDQ